jgi:hypothetical protein
MTLAANCKRRSVDDASIPDEVIIPYPSAIVPSDGYPETEIKPCGNHVLLAHPDSLNI